MSLYAEAVQNNDWTLARRIDLLPAVLSRNHYGRNYDALGRIQVVNTYVKLVDPNARVKEQDFYLYLARIMTASEIETVLYEIQSTGGWLGPFERGFLLPVEEEEEADETSVDSSSPHPLICAFYAAIASSGARPGEQWSQEQKDTIVAEIIKELGGLGILDAFSESLFDTTRPDFQTRFNAVVGALECMRKDVVKELMTRRRIMDDVVDKFNPYPLLDLEQPYSSTIRMAWMAVLRRYVNEYSVSLGDTEPLLRLIVRLNREANVLDNDILRASRIYDFDTGEYAEAFSESKIEGTRTIVIGPNVTPEPYRIQALMFAFIRLLRIILYPNLKNSVKPIVLEALRDAGLPKEGDVVDVVELEKVYDDTPILLKSGAKPAEPVVPPYPQSLVNTKLMFTNQGGQSCPYDSMFVALFKIPGTFLQGRIWSAKQVYCRVPIAENPQCRAIVNARTKETNADVLHRSILFDIRAMQGFEETQKMCATYKLWKTCIEVEAGTNSLVDDPRVMSLRLCQFYGLVNGADFVYAEVRRNQSIGDAIPLPQLTCSLVIVSLENAAAEERIGTTIPLTIHNGTYTLVSSVIYSPGHWMAVVFDPRTRQWWFFDDMPRIKQIDRHDNFPSGGVQKGWYYMRTADLDLIAAVPAPPTTTPTTPTPEPMEMSEDDEASWTPEEEEEEEEEDDGAVFEDAVETLQPPPTGVSEQVWRNASRPSPGEVSYVMPRDDSLPNLGMIDMKDDMGKLATLNGWKITGWNVTYEMPHDVVEKGVTNAIIRALAAEQVNEANMPRTFAQMRMLQEIVNWPRTKDAQALVRLEQQSRIFLGGKTFRETFPNYSWSLEQIVLELEEQEEDFDASVFVPTVRDEKKEEEERRERELNSALRPPEQGERGRRIPSILMSKADPNKAWDALFGLDRAAGTVRFDPSTMSLARTTKQLEGVRMILTNQVTPDKVRILYLQSLLPKSAIGGGGGGNDGGSDPESVVDALKKTADQWKKRAASKDADNSRGGADDNNDDWATGKATYY